MPAHRRFVATDNLSYLSLRYPFGSDLLLQEWRVTMIAERALRHLGLTVASLLQLFEHCLLISFGSQSVAQIAIQTTVSLRGRFEKGGIAQWR